jgi:hypothetical protein
MMDRPRLLTAWDQEPEDDIEADWGMGMWYEATHNGVGFCAVCKCEDIQHQEVAALVAKQHDEQDNDDDDLMLLWFVCRTCAPTEARARQLADTIMRDVMGRA